MFNYFRLNYVKNVISVFRNGKNGWTILPGSCSKESKMEKPQRFAINFLFQKQLLDAGGRRHMRAVAMCCECSIVYMSKCH